MEADAPPPPPLPEGRVAPGATGAVWCSGFCRFHDWRKVLLTLA